MKTSLKRARALACLLIAAASAPAHAEQFSCPPSPITEVAQSNNGGVYIRTTYGMFSMCSVAAEMGGIPPESCRAWLTEILTARGLGKSVEFYFDTAHPSNALMTAPYCVSSNFGWHFRPPYFVSAHLAP